MTDKPIDVKIEGPYGTIFYSRDFMAPGQMEQFFDLVQEQCILEAMSERGLTREQAEVWYSDFIDKTIENMKNGKT